MSREDRVRDLYRQAEAEDSDYVLGVADTLTWLTGTPMSARLADTLGDPGLPPPGVDESLDGILVALYREGFVMPFMAHARDYITEGSEGEQRAKELAALHAADAEAEQANRDALRRALDGAT